MPPALAPLIEKLLARGHLGMELGLGRSERAARALGDPERGLRVIHVAGTNGKGSTAAMVESIARAAGLRTALYTSPHLTHFRERIQVGGEPISEAVFADALAEVFARAPSDLTFFETLTMAAFVVFAAARPDVVVLEVGLGGRLDATNIVRGRLATAITTITEGQAGRYLEHAEYLGDTVAAIAREKAGILEAGVPCVLGRLGAEASDAVHEEAARRGAAPVWQITTPAARGLPIHVEGARGRFPNGEAHPLVSGLLGPHQLDNAAVAIGLTRLALPEVGAEAIERGLLAARWPGRLERLLVGGTEVWLDGAHNLEGGRALARALDAQGIDGGVLVFGALADKPYGPLLDLLAPRFGARVYTEPGGRKPAPLDALAALHPGACEPEPAVALQRALRLAGNGGRVLVTGSLYLVGTVRSLLLGRAPGDPALGL